jgi:folate-binding protein YgfZ
MNSSISREHYDAVRRRAGRIDRSNRARIVLSGEDRKSFLHALLTNDIASLQPGHGCYAAYLTPTGRMITDLWVYELGDLILVTLDRDKKDDVLARFDQLIFSEDVRLGDVTDTFASVALVGPAAASVAADVLTGTGANAIGQLPEHGNLRTSFADEPVTVIHVVDPGTHGFEIVIDAAARDAFDAALTRAEVPLVDSAAAEAIRIEGGVPLFGRDMDAETIPLEAGIEKSAISLTKGCYVGQEVIIRVLHRGHGRVARRLMGVVFEKDDVPVAGSALDAAGKTVGRITSATWSPALNHPIALAYLQREMAVPGTQVACGESHGVVVTTPFVPD